MKAKSKQKEIVLDETIACFCYNLLYCHCLCESFYYLNVTSLLIYSDIGSDLMKLEFKSVVNNVHTSNINQMRLNPTQN